MVRRPSRFSIGWGVRIVFALLTLLLALMWPYSYFVCNAWPKHTFGRGIKAISWYGRVAFYVYDLPPQDPQNRFYLEEPSLYENGHIIDAPVDAEGKEYQTSLQYSIYSWLITIETASWRNGYGFYYSNLVWLGKPEHCSLLIVPDWFLLLVTSGTLFLLMRGPLKRHRRRRAGRCLHCGYDLRAHDADARCPECGELRT